MTSPVGTQHGTSEALIANYAGLVAGVRQRVLAFVQGYWRQFPSYNSDRVQQMTAVVVPMVLSGQQQIAALTDAYLAQLYANMTGTQAPSTATGGMTPMQAATLGILAGVLVTGFGSDDSGGHGPIPYGQMRKGVTPEEVYRRPFVTTWTARKKGAEFPEAVAQGENRLLNLVATDMQLAKTHASQRVIQRLPDGVVGYRRVLEGPSSCGLCVLASTQRYHKSKLMPIHSHCDCAVAPIIGDHDPGQVIDDQLVPDVHAAVRRDLGEAAVSRSGKGYNHAMITHNHGELGPVLAVRGEHFDGPRQVK